MALNIRTELITNVAYILAIFAVLFFKHAWFIFKENYCSNSLLYLYEKIANLKLVYLGKSLWPATKMSSSRNFSRQIFREEIIYKNICLDDKSKIY